MGDADRIHLVILVHGIRDVARWQKNVGDLLKSEGFEVAHSSYGRFNLVKFLLPFDFFRKQAADELWENIRSAKLAATVKYPGKTIDVSIIAHSFGTYIVTRIVEAQFDLYLNRIILCGAVVHRRFPFQKIHYRLKPPVLNEVGTRDPWPATADFLTFGYGSAGTTGFNKPFVEDRYHNKAGHNYFLNAKFAKDFWVDFLRDGTVNPGSDDPENPPWWVVLLIVFKLKYLLAAVVILIAAFLFLRGSYGNGPVAAQLSADVATRWNFQAHAEDASEPCPLPVGLCNIDVLTQAITDRRYVRINSQGGSFEETGSCGAFKFPPPDSPKSSDPVALLEHVGKTFPQCVTVEIDVRNNMSIAFHKDAMTEVTPANASFPRTMWLCGCTDAQVQAFGQRN